MPEEKVCKNHSGICAEIESLQESDKDQWEAINKLQSRLPVWATLLFTAMGGLLGSTLTYAAMK